MPSSVLNIQTHLSSSKVLRCTNIPKLSSEFFDKFDVWRQDQSEMDVLVKTMEDVNFLENSGFSCQEWITDLNFLSIRKRQTVRYVADDLFIKQYNDYETILSKLQEWTGRAGGIAKFVPSIGLSIEGRAIPAVHLSVQNGLAKKRIVAICGLHAREWISPQTCMYLIFSLLNNPDLLRTVEFVIFPLVNPDGYIYSRTTDRLWRKNRRNNGDSYGVDLNRNFDFLWSQIGSSKTTKSENYHGLSPASEPEVKALQDYIVSLGPSHIGLDIHSYGQLVLRPYGYTLKTSHPTEASNKILGDGMSMAIKNLFGSEYVSQVGAELFTATGCCDDWLTSKGMIGFTIELRDKGKNGFLLPEEEIIPTGQEMFEAVKFAVSFLNNSTLL
jgi:hypothetical protein